VAGAQWVDENGKPAELTINEDGTITIDGVKFGPPPVNPQCGDRGVDVTEGRPCSQIQIMQFICPEREWRVIRPLRQCSSVVSVDPVLSE